MSGFDGASDVSGAIKLEGEKIAVSFDQGVPVSGQGTVSWNIPSPLAGCATQSSINSAYCGIVVTLSTSASTVSQAPVNGTRYAGDPTADIDLHAGDTINGALVIGAFYEGEKKGRGENLTTDFVVTDLDPDEFYYVTTYAVDCQGRYHTQGIRAYSDDYGDVAEPNSPARSSVTFGTDGVKPTDGTMLNPGQQYGFEFDLNTQFPDDSEESNRIKIEFDGGDAQTYEELLDVINTQLAEADNPVHGVTPPNAGSLQWDDEAKELKVFDGISYGSLPDTIVSDATDPTTMPDGDVYWFDLDEMQFKQRNSTNTANNGWDDFTTIIHPTDPSKPLCDEIWFSGDAARRWSGTVWCELQFFNQPIDPSLRLNGACGDYWFNTDASALFQINPDTQGWDEAYAINMPIAPNAMPSGFFWFDENSQVVRERTMVGTNLEWVPRTEANFAVGDVNPTLEVVPEPSIVGFIWYDRVDGVMYKYDGSAFIQLADSEYVAWPTDPADVKSCTLWWNDTIDPEELRQWDAIANEWVLVSSFAVSSTDPFDPPEIKKSAIWNNTETNEVMVWNGSNFEPATYIDYPTDPRSLDPSSVNPDSPNTAWLNTTDSVWNTFTNGSPLPPTWEVVEPIVRSDDPASPTAGQYWFDDENDVLYQRSAVDTWVPVSFTTKPINNKIGELWYDSNDDQLKKWDGKKWAVAKPKVSAELDGRGQLVFETRDTGSCVSLLMLIPGAQQRTQTDPNVTTAGSKHAGGYMRTYTDNPFDLPRFLETSLPDDAFLFDVLEDAKVQPAQIGSDGLRSEPSYAQIGVGTDGSDDERRELAHSVRVQLGWPTVDVELTEEQIQTAITQSFESLRKRSDIAYRREFYMLDLRPGIQRYALTNRKGNFHKIVSIMGAHRNSGVFGGGGYSSNSIFDQLFTNQLYQNSTSGGFDLTSLHLSQQYLEQIEIMFATRINFHFSEHDRVLHLHQDIGRQERILLDATIDRTEQDMLKDRFIKSWIERHTMAACRLTLSEIRGKFGSLPGAGGGISLNASDLSAQAREDFADCYSQLENYIAAQNEMYGAWDIVIG